MDLKKLFENLEVKYANCLKPGKYDITIDVNYDGEKVGECQCGCKCKSRYEDCNCDENDVDVDLNKEWEDDEEELLNKINELEDLYDGDEDEPEDINPVKELHISGCSTLIVVENAVNAIALYDNCCDYEEDLEDSDTYVEPEVKLINVNKNVSKALETIYDVIQEVNDDNDNEAYFDLVDEFPELFENVREETMDKVLDRINKHLTLNNFNVETEKSINEHDGFIEKVYSVLVTW